MSEVVTVRIESIAAGGAGVARVEGMAVFVHRTAPGDVAEITLRRRKRFGEGVLRRVLEPSPERVEPRCVHYEGDSCGGCQLQHLSYDAQRTVRRRIVADGFSRIARRAVAVEEVRASPSPWGYRNKLTLTMRPRGAGWMIGMRPLGEPDGLFEVRECPITDAGVMDSWREIGRASADLPRTASLRGAVRTGGGRRSLVLTGGESWPHARRFAAACPSLSTIVWNDEQGRAHVIVARDGGDGAADSFAQVNPAVARAIHADVLARVREEGPARVIDAYAGRGALAADLAEGIADVIAIELDPEAVRLARHALGPRGEIVHARVEDVIGRLLPANAVVLNPPRAGLDARVCTALEAVSPRPSLVVYVSCDPATLARDVSRLPSYRVESATPFDMFPQTAHVETVCLLRPGAA